MARSFINGVSQEEVNKMFHRAAEKAIAETFAMGLPITRDVDGVTSRVYPDGRVEPVKPANPVSKKKLAA
jgi:hypothetical protein